MSRLQSRSLRAGEHIRGQNHPSSLSPRTCSLAVSHSGFYLLLHLWTNDCICFCVQPARIATTHHESTRWSQFISRIRFWSCQETLFLILHEPIKYTLECHMICLANHSNFGFFFVLQYFEWPLGKICAPTYYQSFQCIHDNNAVNRQVFRPLKGFRDSLVRLKFVNTLVCLSTDLSRLPGDAAVETLTDCLIFHFAASHCFPSCSTTRAPLFLLAATGSLHLCHGSSRGETLIDAVCIFYVPALCSQLADSFEEHLFFRVGFFFPPCLIMSRFYSQFPVELASSCYATLEEIGDLW